MSQLIAVARRTLVKDFRLEWRSKDAINSMLFFSLLVVVIFSFYLFNYGNEIYFISSN